MVEPKRGERVFVRPLHDRVPMSENAGAMFLPREGRELDWSQWWWQRRREGDVEIVAPEKPAPVRTPAKAEK